MVQVALVLNLVLAVLIGVRASVVVAVLVVFSTLAFAVLWQQHRLSVRLIVLVLSVQFCLVNLAYLKFLRVW